MSNFRNFLESVGGLHDARVSTAYFDIEDSSFTIKVDDIYSGLIALPGGKGAKSGSIVLRKISRFSATFQLERSSLNIYDLSILKENGNGGTLAIKFWPAGNITLDYGEADFPNL